MAKVVPFRGVGLACPTCRGAWPAHRDTAGRWVGCNLARLALLADVHLRLRRTLARCPRGAVQPFGIGEDTRNGSNEGAETPARLA
jgi:hypothetical protein